MSGNKPFGVSFNTAIACVLVSTIATPALAQVQQIWTDIYDGPHADLDIAFDLAIDAAGNIIVVGATDGDDSTFDADFLTIKYSPSGVRLWVATHAGAAGLPDEARAVAIDSQNNVIVTGRSSGGSTNDDYLTIKYSSTGAELWAERYEGGINGFDVAYDVAVDSQDNVIVTGYSVSSMGLSDFLTIKYSPAGVPIWTAHYNSGDDTPQIAQVLTLDDADNVYVAGGGCEGLLCSNFDYETVKYSSSGAEQWVAHYAGPGDSEDFVYDIAVDGGQAVYVTGRSVGADGTFDYATVKFRPDGTTEWFARYASDAAGEDQATALELDSAGNPIVTGYSAESEKSLYDIVTIQYDRDDGGEIWSDRFDGGNQLHDIALGMALDPAGFPVITGSSEEDYITLKYDGQGNRLWDIRYAGPDGSSDTARAVAIDGQGNVYITGHLGTSAPGIDAATVKYSDHCPGDVNGDGIVDLADLALLLSHFGASGGSDPSEGDLDHDEDVDLGDLAILLSNFGNSC